MIDETRKATQWGKSKTLVVSLPRRWIKKFGIEPDSQLHIQEGPEGSLRVRLTTRVLLLPHCVAFRVSSIIAIRLSPSGGMVLNWL